MVSPDLTRSRVQKFIRTVSLVCKSPLQIAIYDDKMSLTWSDDSFDCPKHLPESPSQVRSEGSNGVIRLTGDSWKNCYLMPLHVYRMDDVAFILMHMDNEPSSEMLEEFSYQIGVVQGFMAESEYLDNKLSENTRELRHFQQLSDGVAGARLIENPELELSLVLKDCVDSMSLAGAFLYHTDSKSIYSETTNEENFENTGLSSARRSGVLQRDLFRLAETSSAAFVLEQFAKKGASSSRNKLESLQVLVTPVIDLQKQCSGVLVLARTQEDNKFSKSECRLVELMADRVYGVLQSRYDSTSGFLNHTAYESILGQALGECKQDKPESSFLILKLEKLDEIYANGGTEAGLHIISQVSALLGKRVRNRDHAGRIGKDEFALLLNNCKTENAVIVADQILESLSEFTFDCKGQALGVEGNIGIVTMSNAFVSPENLLRAAREAVDLARETGKYEAAVYNGLSGKRRELSRISWDHRIYKSVINKDFRLYCQPIEGTASYNDGLQRYELFLRLKSDDGVLVAPYVFISTARKLGLMKYVDQWVVKNAFELAGAACEDDKDITPYYGFTINLSADSLNMEFADFLIREAEKAGVVAESICFDITEAAATGNLRETNKFIGLLKKRGFEFALDDFGTGIGAYSSLRNLAVDYVKLNGALVKNIAHDPVSDAIVSSLSKVCRSLGIKVIAESVESEAVKERLISCGVDYIQGYQAGRPRPVEKEFGQFLDTDATRVG